METLSPSFTATSVELGTEKGLGICQLSRSTYTWPLSSGLFGERGHGYVDRVCGVGEHQGALPEGGRGGTGAALTPEWLDLG